MSGHPGAATFIGRRNELGVLLDSFMEGTQGQARALIVRGDAGVGKTRLLTEFLARVERTGSTVPVIVAKGQCVELGEIGAPFTPLRRLLRELYLGVGHEAFAAAAGSAVVLSTLATFIPELAEQAGTAKSDGAKDLVAEAIERVLEDLSKSHHLVLVIEDLHWADGATLAVLRNLATTLRGSHLTLIATYRSEDVGRGHPLRALLAEFERNRSISFVDIERLDADAITQLVTAITGQTPSPDVVALLAARSGGVPFYIEELVAVGEGPLPTTLRETVLARYERLTPMEQQVARVISVAGARVAHDVLAATWTGSQDDLVVALRATVASGTLVADDDGYAFRHALIGEAVYDDLLPSERAQLHSMYAQVLQSLVDAGAPEHAAGAAEHWLASRDLERAFDATAVARRNARDNFAPETAALLGERLLELWARVDDAERRAGITDVELRIDIAKALMDAGSTKAAIRASTSSLEHVAESMPVERAELLLVLALCEGEAHTYDKTLPPLREMDRLLGDTTDPRGLELLHRARASIASVPPGAPELSNHIDAALEYARSAELYELLGYVHRRRADLHFLRGELLDAIEQSRASLAVSTGYPRIVVDTGIAFTDFLGRAGAYAECIEAGTRAFDTAVELGMDRGSGAFILSNVAYARACSGQTDAALRDARRSRESTPRDNSVWQSYYARVEASALVWSGRVDEAMSVIAATAQLRASVDDDYEEAVAWAAVLVDCELASSIGAAPAKRLQSAQRTLALAQIVTRDDADPMFTLPAAASLGLAVAVARAEGLDRPHEVADSLDSQLSTLPDEPWLIAPRAFLAACNAPSVDAERAWALAHRAARGGALPVWFAHESARRLALARAANGDRDGAIALLRGVLEQAPTEGSGLVARWARGDLKALGAGTTAGALVELTPREREVLGLVAEGLSNGEIGKRLFISSKTASVHVSAILAKLGAANRAEAAALYARAED